MEQGDIWLADLRDERRVNVLVVSNALFHRETGRALVAPRIDIPRDDVHPPWRIVVAEDVFAVEQLRSLATSRLLRRLGTAPYRATAAAARAVRMIS